MKGIVWVIIILAIVGGVWYLFTGLETPDPEVPTVEGGPIKVGAIVPLTGDGAAYGLPIQKAGQLAVEEINAAGGISGREISVIWEDGQCDSKGAVAAAQKLVNVDEVKYILGGVCSSEVLAAAPITENSGVLLISPSATSPDVTDAGDYVFRTAPSDALAGKIAAQYAYNKLEAETVAIISETKDYTQGLRRVFRDEFERLGGEVVVDETFGSGDTDFSTQVLKMKSEKPDVVYVLPQAPDPGLLILEELKSQEVNADYLTAEVLVGRDVVAENSDVLEGLIGVEPYFNEENPETEAFASNFKARYEEELAFPSYMANYYSQFYLLKEAIEAVGDSPSAVQDWLYALSDWEHALGVLSFDSNGDPRAQYQILEVSNQKVHPIEVVQPE